MNMMLFIFGFKAVAASCRAGNNPTPSDSVTTHTSGTYLNTQYPVTCGNHITKWHYCYHTEAATPGATLSITVAVWSLDTATNTYIVSPSSIRNITLQPIQTLAKIFCVEESLNETEYVVVSTGDLIGVVLPSNNVIPVISSNSESAISMKFSQSEVPLSFLKLELLNSTGIALHLYASIGKLFNTSFLY